MQKKNDSSPPPLPSRNPLRPGKPLPSLPPFISGQDRSPGHTKLVDSFTTEGEETNHYEQVVVRQPQQDASDSSLNTRLWQIEDNQMRMRNELNLLQEDIMKDLQQLRVSLKELLAINESFDESMRESFDYMQSTIDQAHTQLLQNSDELGKQILDVRRDIVSFSCSPSPVHRSAPQDVPKTSQRKVRHTFEWEIGSLSSMQRKQLAASSQSYLIAQLDFKVLGGASCTSDGRLKVRIHGEFTHMTGLGRDERNYSYECSVFMVDKLGRLPDSLLGCISGDFSKEKEKPVGEMSIMDITEKGYVSSNGNVTFKFVIDVAA